MIAIYTLIGASTVALPVILSLVDREGMEPRLLEAKEWLARNSTTVTALIVIVIGVVIIGVGLSEF